MKHPVVVELYSPRVATGQQLSDALIEIANAAGGKFLLARLNVDTAPGIVQALGLQAVPTVIALIGGQVAPLFQGVLPRDQAQAAIDQLLQAAVANGIVGRAEPVGGRRPPTTSSTTSRWPTRGSPRPTRRWPAATSPPPRPSSTSCWRPTRATPRPRPARPRPGCSPGPAASTRRSCWRPRRADDSVGVQLDAADVELVSGQVEAAFDRLIGLIKTKSGDERNEVRVRLLELFETVGNADPRVLKARRDLMTALF